MIVKMLRSTVRKVLHDHEDFVLGKLFVSFYDAFEQS